MYHGPRCELLTVFGFQLIDYFYRGSYWLVWHSNSPPPHTHTHTQCKRRAIPPHNYLVGNSCITHYFYSHSTPRLTPLRHTPDLCVHPIDPEREYGCTWSHAFFVSPHSISVPLYYKSLCMSDRLVMQSLFTSLLLYAQTNPPKCRIFPTALPTIHLMLRFLIVLSRFLDSRNLGILY
jgi:hypothetical protein